MNIYKPLFDEESTSSASSKKKGLTFGVACVCVVGAVLCLSSYSPLPSASSYAASYTYTTGGASKPGVTEIVINSKPKPTTDPVPEPVVEKKTSW